MNVIKCNDLKIEKNKLSFPCPRYEGIWGVEVKLHSFLTLALNIWMVNFTPQPLYIMKNTSVFIDSEPGWVPELDSKLGPSGPGSSHYTAYDTWAPGEMQSCVVLRKYL